MKFDPNSQPPTFASDNEIIEKGSKVRIQLVGTRVEAAEMVSAIEFSVTSLTSSSLLAL
jgi:hypothetical protein